MPEGDWAVCSRCSRCCPRRLHRSAPQGLGSNRMRAALRRHAAFDFGQAQGKEPRNAGLFFTHRIEHAGTPRGRGAGGMRKRRVETARLKVPRRPIG